MEITVKTATHLSENVAQACVHRIKLVFISRGEMHEILSQRTQMKNSNAFGAFELWIQHPWSLINKPNRNFITN